MLKNFHNFLIQAKSSLDKRLSFQEYILLLLGGVLQGTTIIYNFLINPRPIIGADALIFQYSGWYISQGGVVYSGVWDIKPPLIHYLAAVISLISGGNVFTIYVISVLLMGVSFLLISIFVFRIVNKLTNNERAAFAASIFLFTFPAFYNFSTRGLRPKMFVILFGLLTIWYLMQDRYIISAIYGAIAAGFWQYAIIFPAVPVLYVIYKKDWKAFRTQIIGGSVLVLAVVAPLIYAGVANQLVAEVILAPFLASEELNYPYRILKAGLFLKFSSILLVVGGIGILLSIKQAYNQQFWLVIFGSWFLIQVLFLDLDGPPDLFVGYFIVSIGFGIAVDYWYEYDRMALLGTSVIMILMYSWLIYVLSTGDTYLWTAFKGPIFGPNEYYSSIGDLHYLYWNQELTNRCHLRLSGAEKVFMDIVGETQTTPQCGRYDLYRLLRQIL